MGVESFKSIWMAHYYYLAVIAIVMSHPEYTFKGRTYGVAHIHLDIYAVMMPVSTCSKVRGFTTNKWSYKAARIESQRDIHRVFHIGEIVRIRVNPFRIPRAVNVVSRNVRERVVNVPKICFTVRFSDYFFKLVYVCKPGF